ncbi:four helix bundle protein [Brumimicrobium oceani]|uniref:ISXO2-like transposase domain-containing protein n=1 Tax=Brumimicrobium oceani TaxID=2100725 RepID=A0A2U2XBY7_9FLAO|nr:hypothetical protein DIT68_09785 [Brumimicrobium oceani]
MLDINFDRYANDQLGRASFSVTLNIAEGSGKFSKKDRKNYFTTARASIFEDHISTEANVVTDGWASYQPLKETHKKLKQI